MLKWKTPSQNGYAGLIRQRKSIELGYQTQKKSLFERLSNRKNPYRRSATEPDEPSRVQNLAPTVQSNFEPGYRKKNIATEKIQTNYRFLTGKKTQKPFKQTNKNIQSFNQSNSSFLNHTNLNDYEWESKVFGGAIMVDNKTESKWKKCRLKQDRAYGKLKEIQNFLKQRRQTDKNEEAKNMKYRCETEPFENASALSKFQFKDGEQWKQTKQIKRENQIQIERGKQKDKEDDQLREREALKTKRRDKQCRESSKQQRPGLRTQYEEKVNEKRKFYPRKSKNKTESSPPKVECEEFVDEKRLVTLNKIGAGTFGQVFTARDGKTGKQYAIKTIYNDKTHKNREIEIMEIVNSNFVVRKLKNYLTVTHDDEAQYKEYIHIIMPKYDSNLYEFFRKSYYRIPPELLKTLLYQMFRGILHLHSRGICHRDLKPQNILIKGNRIVVCDLGSAKILKPTEENISYICSRCYRAPELIFGQTQYSVSIDVWSAGCIMLEFLNKGPLFVGKDSLHHLVEVMKVLGTPSKAEILKMNSEYDTSTFKMPKIKQKKWSALFEQIDPMLEDLLDKTMLYDPSKRLTVGEVLCHPYFSEIREYGFLERISSKHQICTSDFFIFDEQQVKMVKNPQRLIPIWFLN